MHLHDCVAGGVKIYLVLSHSLKGTRSQGEGPQVGRKVVRACSQPQGMVLHFETRRSGVGECARPGEVPILGVQFHQGTYQRQLAEAEGDPAGKYVEDEEEESEGLLCDPVFKQMR